MKQKGLGITAVFFLMTFDQERQFGKVLTEKYKHSIVLFPKALQHELCE